MNPTTLSNLTDILDCCHFIQKSCSERTFDDYENDRMFRRAMEREFEIVGEALKRIRDDDESVFDSIGHARSIVGFRNRLAHGYDSIDDALVWGIISGYVPVLIFEIESVL
ncbi:MAG: DUF86 domain-containing protein [Kiritimatiellae bacterium]|nr:DUF86 domain-containing protein [Kiritimatiellia bacterium]